MYEANKGKWSAGIQEMVAYRHTQSGGTILVFLGVALVGAITARLDLLDERRNQHDRTGHTTTPHPRRYHHPSGPLFAHTRSVRDPPAAILSSRARTPSGLY